jgi:hypothetical protein
VAWLWVEGLGRPQVMVAEGLKVKSAAVSIMIRIMRIAMPSEADEKLMQSVFETVTESADETKSNKSKIERMSEDNEGKTEPRILVVNHNRKGVF